MDLIKYTEKYSFVKCYFILFIKCCIKCKFINKNKNMRIRPVDKNSHVYSKELIAVSSLFNNILNL